MASTTWVSMPGSSAQARSGAANARTTSPARTLLVFMDTSCCKGSDHPASKPDERRVASKPASDHSIRLSSHSQRRRCRSVLAIRYWAIRYWQGAAALDTGDDPDAARIDDRL